MIQTARLSAPLIEGGQIDKATTHNEALAIFDLAVCAAVDGFLANSPPASPSVGASYIVGASPIGSWAGQARALAGYTAGGWRFVAPVDGLVALVKASGQFAVYRGGSWELGELRGARLSVAGDQVVGPRLAAVADPAGGSTVDTEARAAIAAILDRLRGHGLIAS
jgi:hypothetical protein